MTGCAEIFYKKTAIGHFSGRLTVEWVEPNYFIYRPDPVSPLRFVTSDERSIQPQLMYTDAGSIPRLFWSYPGLGPWDFGPGYVIHDWLFQQHHCKIGDWSNYSFQDSARILAEAIKTQMEVNAPSPSNERAIQPEPRLTWAIYEAVRTPIASDLWEKGACATSPEAAGGAGTAPHVVIRVITFPDLP